MFDKNVAKIQLLFTKTESCSLTNCTRILMSANKRKGILKSPNDTVADFFA